jgi:hypothetical protein
MNYLVVHHRVQNFEQWKPFYEGHQPAREQAGMKEVHLWHGADDPNDLTLLFEASDLSKARAFAESSDLRETMKKAGVIGEPQVSYLKD